MSDVERRKREKRIDECQKEKRREMNVNVEEDVVDVEGWTERER